MAPRAALQHAVPGRSAAAALPLPTQLPPSFTGKARVCAWLLWSHKTHEENQRLLVQTKNAGGDSTLAGIKCRTGVGGTGGVEITSRVK